MKSLSVWGLSAVGFISCGQTASNGNLTDGTTGHITADPVTTGTTGTTGTTTGTATVDQNPPDCPSTEPVPLTDCAPVGLVCKYNDCSFPDYLPPYEATCVDGRWEWTMMGECDLPECPGTTAPRGTPCDAAVDTGPCKNYDGCQELTPVWCIDGVWQGSTGTTTTSSSTTGYFPSEICPDWPPAVGALCCPRWNSVKCNYEDFVTSGVAAAAATGGPGFTPPSTTTPCVSCAPEGVWVESTGCP